MVFGNLGETSGKARFTRNPETARTVYREFLMNAQGEDVVAGIRTHISELQKVNPGAYNDLRDITNRLEKHYRDMRPPSNSHDPGRQALHAAEPQRKRTGLAAVRVAIDMVNEHHEIGSCAWSRTSCMTSCSAAR